MFASALPLEGYRDKEPELGLIESTRARASRLFGGTAARSWLTANGLEPPAQTVDHVTRRVGLAPVTFVPLPGFTARQQGEPVKDAAAVVDVDDADEDA